MLASKTLWSCFVLSLHVCINISAALPTRECGDLPDDKDCFTAGTLRIPRERNLSLKDYYEKYEDTQTPVIIEDYAAAFAGMSESNIKDVCGARNVPIARALMPRKETGQILSGTIMVPSRQHGMKFMP